MLSPDKQAIIISESAQGLPTRTIGEHIGTSHVSVLRHQAKLKAHIERYAAELLQRGLRPAQRTTCRIAAMGNCKDADKDTLKLALDASKVIFAAAQITGGGSGNTIINTMIQVQSAPEGEQAIGLLSEFLKSKITIGQKQGGDAQSHTPPAPIDVTPEPLTPPGQVEGMPNSTPKQGTI